MDLKEDQGQIYWSLKEKTPRAGKVKLYQLLRKVIEERRERKSFAI